MMTAIQTKYVGPTNTKPGRIVANAGMKRRVVVDYDHRVSSTDAHRLAVVALCEKFNWGGQWAIGGTETGIIAVCLDPRADGLTVADLT